MKFFRNFNALAKNLKHKCKLTFTAVLVLVLLFIIYVLPPAFASLQPIGKIEIFSEKLNYQEKEPGSWKVTKSAKWTGNGEAEITFNLESILKTSNNFADVIFVLDVSSSMIGEKLVRVKNDTIELIESLLTNDNNRAGLITFDTKSEIISNLTSDKNLLIDRINNLETGSSTNYYQALLNVDAILKKYPKEENRECIVLFLTDGYPNEDTPSEVGEYNYLKNNYPYININAIQYEMGVQILDKIKNISDNQFIADMDTLNNVLFNASISPITFDNFKITDYIDANYFYAEDVKSINVNQGKVAFDKFTQKVEWTLNNYKSGSKATLTIKAKLKEGLDDTEKIYSTNEKEEITSKIEETEEDITSKKTPVLANNYKVIYDVNTPSGCGTTVVPATKNHSVFETVEISNEVPVCEGYQFKGWKIGTKDVETVNDDYFIMPESDVEIKGTWSKLGISKSMDGTVKENLTLYKQVAEDFKDNSKYVKKYTGDTSTFNGNEEVYYYYGQASSNNVIFANYCWKIVRTTDTGGVKLLYNGVPTDGKCNNTGSTSLLTASQMGTTSNEISFNANNSSLSDVGYMYNTRYDSNYYDMDDINLKNTSFLSVLSKNMGSGSEFNFYYADSLNTTSFFASLKDPKQYVWSSNYNKLVGKYTCLKTDSSSSIFLYKVIKTTPTKMYYISCNLNGTTNDNFILSKSYKTNSDGTYTLVSPITISKLSWIDNYSKYNNYYACTGGENTTCSDMFQIGFLSEASGKGYKITSALKYGNSFTYSNGKFTLKNSKSIWNIYDGSLANYHYTCLDKTDSCSEIKYIYQFNPTSGYIYYLTLKNGETIEAALTKMLNESTNVNDSLVKKAAEYWFSNNMTKYEPYLEDTVWCNDRSIINLGGFNSTNGNVISKLGDISNHLLFTPQNDNNLTCKNISDRFTVNNSNGNRMLRYPIGLLTEQEIKLSIDNNQSPLTNSNSYWSMSPTAFVNISSVYITNSGTRLAGVRPSISLKPDILFSTGAGSVNDPYIIAAD